MKHLNNTPIAAFLMVIAFFINTSLLNASPNVEQTMILPVNKGHCKKPSKCQVGNIVHVRENNIAHYCDFRYQIVYLRDDRVNESEYFCVLRTTKKQKKIFGLFNS